MKSFLVIKGTPNRWFDQQGNAIMMIDVLGKQVPYVTSTAESAVNCDYEIDDPNEVPIIHLSYRVQICDDEEMVKYYAEQQNLF